MYSAASAVLLNELLKGAISLSIAFRNAVHHHHGGGGGPGGYEPLATKDELDGELGGAARNKRDASDSDVWNSTRVQLAAKKLFGEIFRSVLSLLLLRTGVFRVDFLKLSLQQ